MKAKKWLIGLLVVAIAFSSQLVLANPEGPDTLIRGQDERRTENAGVAVEAQAGNVTALSITATQITRRWQGFYGNITGNLTLDDANGNSLYRWELANPRGEIYAVNSSSTPEWSDVFCFNFSNNKSDGGNTVQQFNGTDLEETLGMDADSADGVDETFNRTFTGSFQVGSSVTIDANSGCSLVNLFVNDQYQEVDFEETILTDNESVIYTAILEQDATGFQGSTLDFQMIVGDNGDSLTPTEYYFYVELT